MKLRSRILVTTLVPLVVILTVLSVSSYLFASSMLREEHGEKIEQMSARYGAEIGNLIEDKKGMLMATAEVFSRLELSDKELEKMFAEMKDSNSEIMNFFIGLETGRYVDALGWVPPAGYNIVEKDWYRLSIGHADPVVSQPYVSTINGNAIITISKEMRKNGKRFGMVGADISLEQLQNMVRAIKIEKTGSACVLDASGKYVAHAVYTVEDDIHNVENGKYSKVASKLLSNTPLTFEAEIDGQAIMYATSPIEGTEWHLVMRVPKSEFFSGTNQLGLTLLLLSIGALLLMGGISLWNAVSVSKPIRALSTCVEGMAGYDLTLTDQSPSVIYSKQKDEIGAISRSLISVKNTLKEVLTKVSDVANQVSASSQQLTATSEQSAHASEEVARSVDEIAQGAQSQAEDMQEGTEAMSVMKTALEKNKEVVEALNETTKNALAAQKKGVQSVRELVAETEKSKMASERIMEAITTTNESANQISSASNMIKSIADQTNLLALNAAIEAARAGEAGRGFAVVAEEIRKLAEQSTEFTEEIGKIVENLTTKTSETVEIMNSVGEIVANQSGKVSETDTQFDAISAALEQTQQAVGRLNESGEELSRTENSLLNIIENLSALSEENAASAQQSTSFVEEQAASAHEIAASSGHLAEMAQELTEMISVFKM